MALHLARSHLLARVNIPSNATSPPGLIQANTQDPFNQSYKYGLVWIYFGLFLLVPASATYYYHAIADRIRVATRKENIRQTLRHYAALDGVRLMSLSNDDRCNVPSRGSVGSTTKMTGDADGKSRTGSSSFEDLETGKYRLRKNQFLHAIIQPARTTPTAFWEFRPLNITVALFRYVFYRQSIEIIESASPSTFTIVFVATAICFLYAFLPQPLFWQSMAFGSPPLAVRAGMMAVAMTPWIVVLSTKANLVSVATGIGHERLNRLHRWGGYLCMALSIVHTVPFFVQSAQDPAGFGIWKGYFQTNGMYIFGTGIYIHSSAKARD
jgi:hypothetical protein